jgi:5-methyltetrahydropteroyltriglutamate--homocysteine methyltransferase
MEEGEKNNLVRGLKDVVGIPVATTHVGRFPRPSWFTYNFEDRDAAPTMAADQLVEEAYFDAVKAFLKDQESLGVDVVTDGCFRYDDGDWRTIGNWWTNAVCRIGGLRRVSQRPKNARPLIESLITREHSKEVMTYYPTGSLVPAHPDPYVWPFWYIAEEKLSPGKLDSSWVEFFKISQQYTSKPLKFSCVDASLAAYMLVNEHHKNDRDLFFDLCGVYNLVLKELAKAGCKIIQLDWPLGGLHHVANRAKVSQDLWKDMTDGFNAEVEGVDSQIWMHFCFGRTGGPIKLNCIETMKHLGDCNTDVIQLEAASTKGELLDAELSNWKEYCSDKDFCVGVVTPYTLMAETIEEAANIIKKALAYVPPERLAATSDEGFRGINRKASLDKLKIIVEAARIAREEGYKMTTPPLAVSASAES